MNNDTLLPFTKAAVLDAALRFDDKIKASSVNRAKEEWKCQHADTTSAKFLRWLFRRPPVQIPEPTPEWLEDQAHVEYHNFYGDWAQIAKFYISYCRRDDTVEPILLDLHDAFRLGLIKKW